MFITILFSVAGLPSQNQEAFPGRWSICDGDISGKSACQAGQLGTFDASMWSVGSPKVYHTLERAVVTYNETFCRDILELDAAQQYVSGKIVGTFVPSQSGNHTFYVTASHARSGNAYYLMTSPLSLLIDFDTGNGESKGDITCSASSGEGCYTSSGVMTNCPVCQRSIELTAGVGYPFYAGVLTTFSVPINLNLTLEFYYKVGGGSVRYVRASDTPSS